MSSKERGRLRRVYVRVHLQEIYMTLDNLAWRMVNEVGTTNADDQYCTLYTCRVCGQRSYITRESISHSGYCDVGKAESLRRVGTEHIVPLLAADISPEPATPAGRYDVEIPGDDEELV